MPFTTEQKVILGRLIDLKVAVEIDLYNFTMTNFKKAINAVEDHIIKESSKKISNLIRDKPQTSRDLAVWWVEYVMRNPSLDHLKSPTLKMTLVANKSYDVMLVPICLLFFVMYFSTKFFVRPKHKLNKKD